jgi:hypothetical protein
MRYERHWSKMIEPLALLDATWLKYGIVLVVFALILQMYVHTLNSITCNTLF